MSQGSESRRVAHNAAWSAAGFLVPTLVMLVGIPVYVHFLGVRQFGLWTLSNSVLALAGVLNLGLGEATTKFVAEHQGRDDADGVARVTLATLVFYAVIGVAGTAGLWLLAPWLATGPFVLVGAEAALATRAIRVVALGFLPTVSMTVVTGLFDGLQEMRVSQLLLMLRSVLAFGAGVLALVLGGGLVGLLGATVSVVWLVCLTGAVLGLRKLPRLPRRQWHLGATLRRVMRFSAFTALTGVGTAALSQIDKLLVGSLIGLEAVSYYGIGQSLGFKIHGLASAAARVLMPFFSAREARSGAAGLSGPFLLSWRVSLLISLSMVTAAVATGRWFLELWVGPEVAGASFGAFLFFVGAYGLHALNVVPYFYLIGRGRPEFVAGVVLSGGAAMIAGIAVLAPTAGLLGAAGATLAYPVVCWALPVMAVRMAEIRAVDLLGGVWLPVVVHAGATATGLLVGSLAARAGGRLGGFACAAVVAGAILLAGALLQRRGRNPYYQTLWRVAGRALSRAA